MTTSSNSALFGQSNSAWSGNGYNYSVTAVRFGNISTIGSYSIQYCYSLKYVLISNSITTINQYAFAGSLFKFIIIPNSITRISATGETFSNCYALANILLPNVITQIESSMFYNNYSLKKIIISNNITKIQAGAYSQDYSLNKVVFPASITTLGSMAFATCYALTLCDFTHSNSVVSVGSNTFNYNINKILKIIVPDSLYSEWITTTNWVTLAEHIIKESDYNA